jgi:hypothetical protein
MRSSFLRAPTFVFRPLNVVLDWLSLLEPGRKAVCSPLGALSARVPGTSPLTSAGTARRPLSGVKLAPVEREY